MKKFTKIFALCVSVAALSALAGCNKNTASSKTATSANWNVRTSSAVEYDSVDFWRNNKEVATYSVSFTKGSNTTYSVAYTPETAGGDENKTYKTDGVYTTAFYIDKTDYDWTSESIPEKLREEDEKTSIVYVFETSFTVSGKYVLSNGTEGDPFTDQITSICKFRLAGENLKPVYSRQVIKNVAARNLTASSLEQACVTLDAEYETFYNYKCNKAVTITTDHTDDDKVSEKTYSVGGSYSVFDNSQLRIAARAMALSSTSTKVFNVAVPQSGVTQSCSAAVSGSVQLSSEDEDGAQIIGALDGAEGYVFFKDNSDDENKPRNYRFNAVNFTINGKMTGTSVTNWYSSMENADINYTRCVMIKSVSPLSFGMGTLTYVLNGLTVETI